MTQIQTTHRIGLIVPSSNTVMEPDFYNHVPQGWTVHTSRMFLEDVTVEGESRMLDEFTFPAARDLATAKPDVIVFGCTSAGSLRGNDYDTWLINEITQRTGIPAVSVIRSVREQIQKFAGNRVVVVTPYTDEMNVRIQASLAPDGVDVIHIQGLGIVENTQIGVVPQQQILDLGLKAVAGLNPDGLFLSCTNFQAMDVLPELRRRLPFPVISSNQAALDAAIAVEKASKP